MVAVRTAAVHIAATRMALAAHTSRDTVMAAVYIAAVCMAAVCMTAVCMAAVRMPVSTQQHQQWA